MEQVHELSLAPFHVATRDFVVGCDFQGALVRRDGLPQVSFDRGAILGGLPGILAELVEGAGEQEVGGGIVGVPVDHQPGEADEPIGDLPRPIQMARLAPAAAISWNQLVK